MQTSSPPTDLPTHLYYQVVHTLIELLPPPPNDTPEALLTRNHAAIAKIAALLPVNANEADLAAQCITARAQAEDMLRLLRQNADDTRVVLRLNAQYGSMVRTSLSVHAHLMRVQALRHKRQAIDTAANQDAWTQHVAERSMLVVVHPNAGRPEPVWPTATPEAASATTHVEAQPACEDHKIEANAFVFDTDVSGDEANSQDAAFETWLSDQPWNQDPKGSDAGPSEAAQPQATPATTPIETVSANAKHGISDIASKYEMNSQDAAFETFLSKESWYHRSRHVSEPSLREIVRAAIAKAPSGTKAKSRTASQ